MAIMQLQELEDYGIAIPSIIDSKNLQKSNMTT